MRALTLSLLILFALPLAAGAAPGSKAFSAADKLIDDQKFEAALASVKDTTSSARSRGDDAVVAEGLIKATQLEMGLSGFETAVRALKAAEWPKGGVERVLLNLYYGRSLMNYQQQYSWEISKREKTASANAVDLKAWTTQEIGAEISRTFDAAIAEGAWLAKPVPESFRAYLEPNNYPPGVRPTLRDAITYLAVEHLENQQFWTPTEANSVYKQSLAQLLADGGGNRLPAADASVHPLARAISWLAALERAHRGAGEEEAANEARYMRFEQLHSHFGEKKDQETLREAVRAFQASAHRSPWWARGQALLANFLRGVDKPGKLIDVRAAAVAGRDAFPGTPGGQMCAAILWEIEHPELALSAMANDAPAKRSLLLNYRNVRKVYFRAYRIDLEQALKKPGGIGAVENDLVRTRRLHLEGEKQVAEWSEELAETKDYVTHRHFVTPPALAPGMYHVAVSLNPDFGEANNLLELSTVSVGNLVLESKAVKTGVLETRVVAGDSGAPVAGAKVTLYRFDYQTPSTEVKTVTTGKDGYAEISTPGAGYASSYFMIARHGEDFVVARDNVYFARFESQEPEISNAFVYTDRAIYRPNQKIFYKVVAYTGRSSEGRYEVAKPGTTLEVRLMDPNYKEVAKHTVKLGAFGSGSGEFSVPAGHPLGNWLVQTSPAGGNAGVRVEEYKRPTFETTLKEAAAPLRLNRKAHVAGEARYYFGLPVTAGAVHWRVQRTEVTPWWWEFWGWWRGGRRRNAETVASGSSEVGKDGSFAFDFLPEADERKSGEKGLSYNFEVSVDVTDEGGETRSASRSFRLGFVAVETRLAWDEGFFRPGASLALRANLTDLDGRALSGKAHFRVARLDAPATPLPADLPRDVPGGLAPHVAGNENEEESAPDSGDAAPAPVDFALPDDGRRARWETGYHWEAVTHLWKEAETVSEGALSHDAKGEAVIHVPAITKPGVYRVSYDTKDSFGATFEVSRDFLVAGSGVNLPVVAVAEHPSRKVGETATFFVHSGLSEQPLELEVYRAGQRVLKRAAEGDFFELPVTHGDRGGFSLLVTGLRDHQVLSAQTDEVVPWSDRALKVEFSTFRDKFRPGEKENFKITVKSDSGAALEKGGAEVLAYMYDRSLDFFGPHTYPEVLPLYPTRTGAILSSYSLGIAGNYTLFSNLPGGPATPYFSGDRLSVYSNYGIGGLGTRKGYGGGGENYAMEAESVMMDAESGAPAAAMQVAPMAKASRAAAEPMALADKADKAKDGSGNSAGKPAAPAVEMRSNFAETAFFAPHLTLGAGGTASVEFTAPDSVTSWKVLAHALTRDLRGGTATRDARSVKELMVRPYAPRFLREGDDAEIRVQVNDAGDSPMNGELSFDVEDVGTGKSVLALFGVKEAAKKFHVDKGGSVTLAFPLRAPRAVGDYAFKVSARAGAYTDGERRPFPVLPSRLHLAQSRFVTLHDKDSKTLAFADLAKSDDPTLTSEKMVVTVDAQLFYGVLQSLPYLVRYPYECTEQTLNRFLSTGIVGSVFKKYPSVAEMAKQLSSRKTQYERFDEEDANRRMRLEETPFLNEAEGGNTDLELINILDPGNAARERESALEKLRKLQLANGAFPWFQGGEPDEYMTLYILMSLTRAIEFKVEVPKDMVTAAWRFEQSWLDERIHDMLAKDYGWETITQLNFALSGYPDKSWTGGAFDDAYRRKLLDFSFKHWKEHAPLEKGYLALTLKRMGREKDAHLVWESVMDSAKHTDELGTFWAREDRSWLWYNDEIDTQAFALRTQMELDRKDVHNEGLVQWLFLNKKLNHWKSTRSTAEVIYALTHYLDATAQLGVKEAVKVEAGDVSEEFRFDPERYTGKKNQLVIPGPKVDPKTTSKITVSKESKGFAFASATWHFATDKLPEEERGDFFNVSRKYFRREHVGSEWRLTPLAEGAKIAVGDELEVQLSLRAKHEAEYVHLRDPRGAGFEPETVDSGWKWDLGISWYEETRDSGSNFFFARLPVGEYTFHYRVRANMAGTFRVGPAEVQSMYAPEFNAYSAGQVLRVE